MFPTRHRPQKPENSIFYVESELIVRKMLKENGFIIMKDVVDKIVKKIGSVNRDVVQKVVLQYRINGIIFRENTGHYKLTGFRKLDKPYYF